MIGAADAVIAGITSRSPWAPLLAAACGVATSIAPCAAPRAAALSVLTRNRSSVRAFGAAFAFVAGICICYATAAYLAACAGRSEATSSTLYYITALALCACGIYGLVGEGHVCANDGSRVPSAGFALGAFSATLASPCCTVLVFPIAIAAAQAGDPANAALLMACFSVGHALPAVATVVFVRRAGLGRKAPVYLPALQTVMAAVTLATGIYYGVLA